MAEVNNTDGVTLSEASAVIHATQPPLETHVMGDTTVPTMGASVSEAHAMMAPTMRAPEAFTSGDVATNQNPVTTAGLQPPFGDQDSSTTNHPQAAVASEVQPELPQIHQNTPNPNAAPEISATGWVVPSAVPPASRITFDDYLTLSEITFEWGDSYDDKDWMRLQAILAPTLVVDYTEVNGHKWESMPASDFVGIMSHIGFVGDPLVHTQHHIGASKWRKISDEEVIGHHQLRAAHQRYTSSDLKTVENKGNGHAMVQHLYRKVDGEWKLAGLRPTVRWSEFEPEKTIQRPLTGSL